MWFIDTPAQKAEIRDREIYASLDVATQGRDLFLEPDLYDPFGFASVLRLPVLLERFVPMLPVALDGDLTTRVDQ